MASGLARLDELLAPVCAAGLTVHTAIDLATVRVPAPVGAAVCRIVQESLTNLLRHAQATTVAVDTLHRAWAGESVTGDQLPVGPAPAAGNRVPVLIGGTSDAAVQRTVKYAEGWTAGGGGPAMAAPMIAKVRQAWQDAGREDEPRIAALVYFGLSDPEGSRAALRTLCVPNMPSMQVKQHVVNAAPSLVVEVDSLPGNGSRNHLRVGNRTGTRRSLSRSHDGSWREGRAPLTGEATK